MRQTLQYLLIDQALRNFQIFPRRKFRRESRGILSPISLSIAIMADTDARTIVIADDLQQHEHRVSICRALTLFMFAVNGNSRRTSLITSSL